MTRSERVVCDTWERDRCTIVHLSGELSATTYGLLRDTLVKLALDQPHAVIADIRELWISSPSALTAFSSAWMRINDWPHVPILLVSDPVRQHALVTASSIHRFVPVFDGVDQAVAAADSPVPRRRTELELLPVVTDSARARRFVEEICADWDMLDVASNAGSVVTELVENAVQHARTPIRLRLELRSGLLSIAVTDGSPQEAVLREDVGTEPPRTGLRIVSALARAWGCSPVAGGKVVWVVLATAERQFQLLRS